ncbi:hypothetical protein [Cellulomonas sp.]
MELRYYPTTDILQNLLAGIITAVTRNPFLGTNAVFAISFPVTALAALWVMRIVGLRGPMAIFTSLAFTTIPFHWLRLEHVYLATMYSAAMGVGLAILVGSGEIAVRLAKPQRRRHILILLGVTVVIATSGIYYACFTLLLCIAALVYRYTRGSRWREILANLIPIASVAVFTAMALAPAWLYDRSNPAIQAVAGRQAFESAAYSGALAYALLPAPFSMVPGLGTVNDAVIRAYKEGLVGPSSGVLVFSNFGSLFTLLALALAIVGLLILKRRSALSPNAARGDDGSVVHTSRPGFGLIGTLLGTALLFFVPWGLNYLFAFAVTPQLRGWDRLLPALFLLVFAAAAVVWRDLRIAQTSRRTLFVSAVCLGVLLLDSVLPYRSQFNIIAAAGTADNAQGQAYAAALNAALPGKCGVLELPQVDYPEAPPVGNLTAYDQFWPALTNPSKNWSFGAMKGTIASAWQKTLGDRIDNSDIGELQAAGFCAIHVDKRGYTAGDADHLLGNLSTLLGIPVASGANGDWQAFALPAPSTQPTIDVSDLAAAPSDVASFYAPPLLTSEPPLASVPEHATGSEWWWISQQPAVFNARSIDNRVHFSMVTGDLRAVECAPREVVVTLRSASESSTTTVRIEPGATTPFTVRLSQATTSADLTLSATGGACTTQDDPRPRTVALVDPVVR